MGYRITSLLRLLLGIHLATLMACSFEPSHRRRHHGANDSDPGGRLDTVGDDPTVASADASSAGGGGSTHTRPLEAQGLTPRLAPLDPNFLNEIGLDESQLRGLIGQAATQDPNPPGFAPVLGIIPGITPPAEGAPRFSSEEMGLPPLTSNPLPSPIEFIPGLPGATTRRADNGRIQVLLPDGSPATVPLLDADGLEIGVGLVYINPATLSLYTLTSDGGTTSIARSFGTQRDYTETSAETPVEFRGLFEFGVCTEGCNQVCQLPPADPSVQDCEAGSGYGTPFSVALQAAGQVGDVNYSAIVVAGNCIQDTKYYLTMTRLQVNHQTGEVVRTGYSAEPFESFGAAPGEILKVVANNSYIGLVYKNQGRYYVGTFDPSGAFLRSDLIVDPVASGIASRPHKEVLKQDPVTGAVLLAFLPKNSWSPYTGTERPTGEVEGYYLIPSTQQDGFHFSGSAFKVDNGNLCNVGDDVPQYIPGPPTWWDWRVPSHLSFSTIDQAPVVDEQPPYITVYTAAGGDTIAVKKYDTSRWNSFTSQYWNGMNDKYYTYLGSTPVFLAEEFTTRRPTPGQWQVSGGARYMIEDVLVQDGRVRFACLKEETWHANDNVPPPLVTYYYLVTREVDPREVDRQTGFVPVRPQTITRVLGETYSCSSSWGSQAMGVQNVPCSTFDASILSTDAIMFSQGLLIAPPVTNVILGATWIDYDPFNMGDPTSGRILRLPGFAGDPVAGWSTLPGSGRMVRVPEDMVPTFWPGYQSVTYTTLLSSGNCDGCNRLQHHAYSAGQWDEMDLRVVTAELPRDENGYLLYSYSQLMVPDQHWGDGLSIVVLQNDRANMGIGVLTTKLFSN